MFRKNRTTLEKYGVTALPTKKVEINDDYI
jgi:hypothetical protein